MSTFSNKIFQNIDNNITKEKNDINKSGITHSSRFLMQLYQILEDKNNEKIIHWGNDGKYFIIENLYDFTEKILPKYYNHSNYASFVRQLNKYNFHKLKITPNENAFQNSLFIKGQKNIISNILKKKKNKNDMNIVNDNITCLVKYKKNNFLNDFNNLGGNNDNNNNKNNLNNLSFDKHSLSLDEDFDNNNSFMNKEKSSNSNSYIRINSNSVFKPIINNQSQMNEIKLKQNLMNENTIEKNKNKQKISKKDVYDLLNDIINKTDKNSSNQKKLNAKMDSLSSKNMEYINKNNILLNEIEKRNELNQKFEKFFSFIQEVINIKNLNNKNLLLSDSSNNNYKNDSNDSELNNLEIINLADPPNEGNKIIKPKPKEYLNNKPINNEAESFQSFFNKYFENSKNKKLLINSENNTNNNFNNESNINKTNNKFISKYSNTINSDNMSYINDPICKEKNSIDNSSLFLKRKRSNSNYSSFSNNISDNLNNNDNMLFGNINQSDFNINNKSELNWNSNINSNNISNNFNRSFDADYIQDKNSYRKDSLNNSSYSFIDIPNKSNLNDSNYKKFV